MFKQKVQAVILAGGPGSLLYPLCENYMKCLLPIGNKPILAYQLELLEAHGFQDVLLITTKYHSKIQTWVHDRYKGKIKPELIVVNDDCDSAEALVKAKHLIKGDFLLLSADSLIDANLDDLLDFHNKSQSSLTLLMKHEDLEAGKKLGKAPLSCNLTDSYDISLVNPDNGELVHITNSDELEEGEFSVKRSVLLKHPKVELMSNLFDTHVYVCNKGIIKLISQLQEIKSIEMCNFKEDFLKFIVNNQEHQDLVKIFSDIQTSKQNDDPSEGLFSNRKKSQTQLRIFTFIQNNFYARRVNNLRDFQQSNWDSMVKGAKAYPIFNQTPNNGPITIVQQAPTKKISPDSILGEDVTINDKVQISRSIIGKNCIIQENVKIVNSIIMRDCVIGTGSIITDCVLSNNTQVQSNVVLEQCYSGPNSIIESENRYEKETFVRNQD